MGFLIMLNREHAQDAYMSEQASRIRALIEAEQQEEEI